MADSFKFNSYAKALYDMAEDVDPVSPNIGNFRVTDGLKALAVGLVAGTAERLHGRPMAGINKTLQRIGDTLVGQGFKNYALAPYYETKIGEDGKPMLMYEQTPVKTGKHEYEIVMMPRRVDLDGYGFTGRHVYCTYTYGSDVDNNGVPEYRPSLVFTEDFANVAMQAYVESPHCRPEDFAFHLEILRGQLVLWYTSQRDEDTSRHYAVNLIETANEHGVETMIARYTQNLLNAGVQTFVTT